MANENFDEKPGRKRNRDKNIRQRINHKFSRKDRMVFGLNVLILAGTELTEK